MCSLTCNTLKESEQNLMKAEKILEELQESKLDVSEVVQLEVELITTQGRLYVQQGKATQAVLLLERSLKLMQSLVSTDGAQIIEAHRWLVRAHQLCSNHEAAIEISLQAKAIAGSSFGPGSTKVAQVIHTIGQAYTCTGNTEHEGLAEQNLLESLSMYKQAGLAESSRALAVLDDLCHLHVHMKKYQEAFERLRSSMGMKREVFGECSEKVAETFHLMGAIRMAQGELPSAYRLMKKCLDIQSILYGPQHKKTKATKETLDTLSRCPGVVAKRNAPKADPSRRHLSAAVEKQKPPK
uniref:Uncharacterized protein n=1 Tax=Eptatretus burgeri TaxID=7764 RepID=A0A8C4QGZ3_EPTBU